MDLRLLQVQPVSFQQRWVFSAIVMIISAWFTFMMKFVFQCTYVRDLTSVYVMPGGLMFD